MSAPTEQWLDYARTDLKSAEILLREEIYTHVCFHCQQCVEKAFKAVLVAQGRDVPRIHAIVTLLQLMPSALMTSIEGDVSIFDDYYIPIRYPDTLPGGLPDGPPGKQDATEALALAGHVMYLKQ
jgi:HEPN domain-containing protein